MLFLDYDEVEKQLVPLWDVFIEYMDGPNMPKMAPPGIVLENFENFKNIAGTGAEIIPLLEQYLTADNSAALKTRCDIFIHSLQHAHELGLFAQWDTDLNIFSHEKSRVFQSKIVVQKILDQHNKDMAKMKHHGEVDMNMFFMQCEAGKMQNALHKFKKQSNTYAVVDPVMYLQKVASTVLLHSTEQCFTNPNGVVQVQKEKSDEDRLRIAVQRSRLKNHEKANAVLLNYLKHKV